METTDNTSQPQKHKMNAFSLLGLGLSEILVLFFLFFLFLAVLNYFNILSLSSLYPNQLGFLPHMTSKSQEKATLNTSGSALTKLINKTSINDIPLAEITKKIGRFVEFPLPSGTGYILSSQYPTIVAIEKDTKNNLVWVAASFYGKQLISSTSAVYINVINSKYYEYKGLTIWYIIDNNTKIYNKTPEGSKPDLSYKTGTDYALNHITVGNTLFQITSQTNGGTKDKPELNMETLKLIKNSIDKENIRNNKVFTMYADQVILP